MVLNSDTYTRIQEELLRDELSYDEIADLFHVTLDVVAEAAEFLTVLDDRQPDEAQEWYDYDPDC